MNESNLVLYFGPMSIFLLTAFFALFNTGIFFVADKHGLIEKYEVHRRPWMPKKCEFCAFFWASALELCTWYACFRSGKFEFTAFCMMFAFAICAAVISVFFARFKSHA